MQYIYHLSNDTNHDGILTFHIIEDIISKHPEVIEQGVLILQSNNCENQYKNKKVFHKMKDTISLLFGYMALLGMEEA